MAMLVAVKNTKVTKIQPPPSKKWLREGLGLGVGRSTHLSQPLNSEERTSRGLSARRLGVQRKWSPSCSGNQGQWAVKLGGAARVGGKKCF